MTLVVHSALLRTRKARSQTITNYVHVNEVIHCSCTQNIIWFTQNIICAIEMFHLGKGILISMEWTPIRNIILRE